MILFYFTPFSNFPDPDLSYPDGLSFISTNMNFNLIQKAYRRGFFPWYIEDSYVHWYSPALRPILKPQDFYISHSLKKKIKKNPDIRINENFLRVMDHCQKSRDFSWINFRYKLAYYRSFRKGIAYSVEYYKDNQLEGGLYGIKTGSIFTGESMFHRKPDGAKIALWGLIQHAPRLGISVIDGQVPGKFLHQMGFYDIERKKFLSYLAK